MTEEELHALRFEAEAELKKLPNVVSVGLGFKETGGQLTDVVALQVFVGEKKDAASLAPEELVPRLYKGAPTDVVQIEEVVNEGACEDHDSPSQLIGGLTISNLNKDGAGHVSVGTLGFFATITGATAPNNVALITNNHVVTEPSGGLGDTIYQPAQTQLPDGTWATNTGQGSRNPVGNVAKLPAQQNYAYQYAGDPAAANYYVDAAAVQINICISSWCHTNCGVSLTPAIKGLGVTSDNQLTDIARAKVGDIVYKVGRRTGRTEGKVVSIGWTFNTPSGYQGLNCIRIQASKPNCDGEVRFSNHGDSGSAYVNAQGQLIGIHFAGRASDPTSSIGCHIHPVLQTLGVVAITKAAPVAGNPAVSATHAEMPAVIDGKPNRTAELRERFLACEEGRRVFAIVDEHRHEVVHLVNHNRRVTVAWHRHEGPAFLNRCIHNARDPETIIPRTIAGISRADLLTKMAEVLSAQGSPALRAALEQHAAEVQAWAAEADDLHAFVDALAARKAS